MYKNKCFGFYVIQNTSILQQLFIKFKIINYNLHKMLKNIDFSNKIQYNNKVILKTKERSESIMKVGKRWQY